MINRDTVKLLRECDSGIKMGIKSIDDCLPHVTSQRMRGAMLVCKDEHKRMKKEIHSLLDRYHDGGKDPNVFATGMSKMKTNMKLMYGIISLRFMMLKMLRKNAICLKAN